MSSVHYVKGSKSISLFSYHLHTEEVFSGWSEAMSQRIVLSFPVQYVYFAAWWRAIQQGILKDCLVPNTLVFDLDYFPQQKQKACGM